MMSERGSIQKWAVVTVGVIAISGVLVVSDAFARGPTKASQGRKAGSAAPKSSGSASKTSPKRTRR
jgi:hypothetical protein